MEIIRIDKDSEMLDEGISIRISGFYDTPGVPYLSKPNSPGQLEQTVFIVLASVAGLAFIVIITLLLCKFQCQVIYAL